MTDYFALFRQPRSPWVDADALKSEFHRRSKTEHPDANPVQGALDFATLNTAYRTLRDPASRLEHLLQLGGHSLPRIAEPPAELSDLFFETASILRQDDAKSSQRQFEKLSEIQATTVASLRGIRAEDISALQAAREQLVFVGRWIDQLAKQRLA